MTPELIEVPEFLRLSTVTMTLVKAVGISKSPFTFQETAYEWDGEQWLIDIVIPPITDRRLAGKYKAFLLKLRGEVNNFLLGDPSCSTPLGVATGIPLVNGGGQTGNTLSTKGWTPSIDGILLEGDYIQIGTGLNARLHMVVSDVNSDGSGNASISVIPSLRYSPADNAQIIVNSPKGVFKFDSSDVSWSADPSNIYTFSLTAREVLN